MSESSIPSCNEPEEPESASYAKGSKFKGATKVLLHLGSI